MADGFSRGLAASATTSVTPTTEGRIARHGTPAAAAPVPPAATRRVARVACNARVGTAATAA